LQRAEFVKAAALQSRILSVQIAIAVLAGATVYVASEVGAYISALATLVAGLVWAWFDRRYKDARSQAERARRATLIMDGLGPFLSPAELVSLEARFSATPQEGAKHEDPAYYAASAPPGPPRLAEMLEETAFWSCQLFRHSANRTWILFAVFTACLLLFLFASIPFVGMQQVLGGVRVACAMLMLLVSADVIGRASAYSKASHDLELIGLRLEKAKATGCKLSDILMILCDYNSAVESAPLFVRGVYEGHRNELNRLWLSRTEAARS
jgi:uncharacterized membrane protein